MKLEVTRQDWKGQDRTGSYRIGLKGMKLEVTRQDWKGQDRTGRGRTVGCVEEESIWIEEGIFDLTDGGITLTDDPLVSFPAF